MATSDLITLGIGPGGDIETLLTGGLELAAPVVLTPIITLYANKRTLRLTANDRTLVLYGQERTLEETSESRLNHGIAVLFTYDDGIPITYDNGAFVIADDMDGALTAKKRTLVLTAEKRK